MRTLIVLPLLLAGCLDFDSAVKDGGARDATGGVRDMAGVEEEDGSVVEEEEDMAAPAADLKGVRPDLTSGPTAYLIGDRSQRPAHVQRVAGNGDVISEALVEPGSITAVMMGGENMLAPSGAGENPEVASGISYYEHDYSLMANGSFDNTKSFEGAIAVQYVSSWTAPGGYLSGATTVTFLADGRIHRYEKASALMPASGSWLLAYMALDWGQFRPDGAYYSTGGGAYTHLDDGTQQNDLPGSLCARGANAVAGWAQGVASGAGGVSRFQLRLWDLEGRMPATYLMASDWVHSTPVTKGDYYGTVLMYFERPASCGPACKCVGDMAGLVKTSPAVTGTGNPTYSAKTGFYTATLAGAPASLTWTAASSVPTAIFRLMNTSDDVKSVRRPNGQSVTFRTDDAASSIWLYLPGGMVGGEALTIKLR